MATVKAIERQSVHQIQSGQVIVDLCSVVKELVENSLDAGATSIDVRFKNHGFESIEVQDNGGGISPDDYETIALKHYTSKLSTYDDLSTLNTFGFRGEALSSLCALSRFNIVTARDGEAPKGTRLDFEISGKLKGTSVAACQKGTTVAVEDLFYNLPVRQRELEKNIKREYKKVLDVLQAYACISTGVRISVTHQPHKGKKVTIFSTKSTQTMKDNIANVFGAKTLSAIIALDLELELQPVASQAMKDPNLNMDLESRQVTIGGFISRPIFGEGRSTPDRQIFFVNSRPCGLPQIAKAFNEVYRSYNITQSPFVFANLQMDTNAYDVNVSPDKRSILLHDQGALLDSLKTSLVNLFEAQDQTVPQAELSAKNLPSFRPLTVNRQILSDSAGKTDAFKTRTEVDGVTSSSAAPSSDDSSAQPALTYPSEVPPTSLLQQFVERNLQNREAPDNSAAASNKTLAPKQRLPRDIHGSIRSASPADRPGDRDDRAEDPSGRIDEPHFENPRPISRAVQDFNDRLASQEEKISNAKRPTTDEILRNDAALQNPVKGFAPVSSTTYTSAMAPFQSAFDVMRSKRTPSETAMITVGSTSSTTRSDSPSSKRRRVSSPSTRMPSYRKTPSRQKVHSKQFSQKMQLFAAPGSHLQASHAEEVDEEDSAGEDLIHQMEGYRRDQPITDSEGDEGEESESGKNGSIEVQSAAEDETDDEYIDDEERRRRDEAQVEAMVRQAEEAAGRPCQEQEKRTASLLKSRLRKDSTVSLLEFLETTSERVEEQLWKLTRTMDAFRADREASDDQEVPLSSKTSPEERLSLTISKCDFAEMRTIGQFNLGFILATRPAQTSRGPLKSSDELFIIDQHASDEIFNFSRLSLSTTLTPQPLVRPHPLELTAVEEETILSHTTTLAKNGFTITVDESGTLPVGHRCRLLTLPTSRETIFDTRDLEELIALLSETTTVSAGDVVRPSRVRRMLAMRACRSSIMIGKHLSHRGMETVVRHMGEIDKPWNCPHGRPTMRHLASLGQWRGWEEGEGMVDDERMVVDTDWAGYVLARKNKGKGGRDEREGEEAFKTAGDVEMAEERDIDEDDASEELDEEDEDDSASEEESGEEKGETLIEEQDDPNDRISEEEGESE